MVHQVTEELRRQAQHTFCCVAYASKEKFDEMQMTVAIRESFEALSEMARCDGDEDGEDDSVVGHAESAVCKLLQVTKWNAALWQVDNEFVTLELQHPTTLRAIEKTNAECIRQGLEQQGLTPPSMAHKWEHCFRISISDAHAAIRKANYSIAHDRDWEMLLSFLCDIHRQQKLAKIQWAGFGGELKGLLHANLTFQFCRS